MACTTIVDYLISVRMFFPTLESKNLYLNSFIALPFSIMLRTYRHIHSKTLLLFLKIDSNSDKSVILFITSVDSFSKTEFAKSMMNILPSLVQRMLEFRISPWTIPLRCIIPNCFLAFKYVYESRGIGTLSINLNKLYLPWAR